uniref:Putative ovule protein n=1 Tax=Solanum chacoense TaxID=4108 RepID=A0A0V0GDL8_SOLCH
MKNPRYSSTSSSSACPLKFLLLYPHSDKVCLLKYNPRYLILTASSLEYQSEEINCLRMLWD